MTTRLPDHTSVLIVGGGPIGMTLALTLQRAGIDHVVLDDKPGPRPHSKAAVLWPRVLEIFDLLGIAERWMRSPMWMHGATFDLGGEIEHVRFPAARSAYPYPIAVGQDVTERRLDEALTDRGVPVVRDTRVTAVRVDDNGAVAEIDGPDGPAHIVCDWIVGCEGSRSIVREAAGIVRDGGQNAGVQIVQGDVRVHGSVAIERDRVHLWSPASAGTLLIIPVDEDGHARVLATLPDDGTEGDPSLGQLQALARAHVPDIVLSDPLWLSRYRTQHLNATRYRAGRAFVAGDTAHVWVPIGGQGMNIGLHDAFDLGWKLAAVISGRSPEALLDTYDTERRPIADQAIAETENAYGVLVRKGSWTDGMLRAIVPYALRLPGVVGRMAEHLDEFDLQYGAGMLVRDLGGDGIAPGKRAPDASVASDGATIRLFDLYRGGRFTLLGFAGDEDDVAGLTQELDDFTAAYDLDAYVVVPRIVGGGIRTRALIDLMRIAHEAYGVRRETVLLVRPDGVVGARATRERLDDLRAVLDAALLRPRSPYPTF